MGLPAYNTVELKVTYRQPIPLMEPMLMMARVTACEGRIAKTEAVLLPASAHDNGIWQVLDSKLASPFAGLRPYATADAEWKRPRPESIGLRSDISYMEALHRFGGPDGNGS